MASLIRAAGRSVKTFWYSVPAIRQPDSPIVLVDVGASRGIQLKWHAYARNIRPILFEPNPDEAELLHTLLRPFHKPLVLQCGLSDKPGSMTLHIGESFGCTSVLEANTAFLERYRIAHAFRSTRDVEVYCHRYDQLYAEGRAPQPDVIKIDIEGFENNVLEGFGHLLDDVIAIETEAWFYEVYKGQALLHDIIDLLRNRGFMLCRLETVPGFQRDLVCVNAFFAKGDAESRSADRQKLDVIRRVLRIAI